MDQSREHIQVFPSETELAHGAAERVIAAANAAISERGRFMVALSGGETPRMVYRYLAEESVSGSLEWNRFHLCFGDERMVPPDDPQSNFRMVREELLSRIEISTENVHRICGELPPAEAAMKYERELRSVFGESIPRFDLILLGLGEDGHTASLFPGTAILRQEERLVDAVFVPRMKSWRVTLTLPVIRNARVIIFLVSGPKKAPILQKTLRAVRPTEDIPATLVSPREGTLLWVADSEAASFMRDETPQSAASL